MISYEEYRAKVMTHFRKYWKNLSDEEVEAYFKNEGNVIVKGRCEVDIKRLKKGEITEQILENGCIMSVGYCLWLMYE